MMVLVCSNKRPYILRDDHNYLILSRWKIVYKLKYTKVVPTIVKKVQLICPTRNAPKIIVYNLFDPIKKSCFIVVYSFN